MLSKKRCRTTANSLPTLTKAGDKRPIKIEPFDPDRHDRTAFFCGYERIDNYLKRSAKKHQKGDFTRVYVAVESGNATVLGFYSVNAHSIVASDLPPAAARNAPRHGAAPCLYLSMIGVDRARQGGGIGQALMVDALRKAAHTSSVIGLKFVVLDVLEDGGPLAVERRSRFYEDLGFMKLPSRPTRMFIPLKDVRAAF
ncbi:MAG: GNAT family N-acetyltransferase [Pseudomonadota bacterium]